MCIYIYICIHIYTHIQSYTWIYSRIDEIRLLSMQFSMDIAALQTEECSQVLRVPSWGSRSLATSTHGRDETRLVLHRKGFVAVTRDVEIWCWYDIWDMWTHLYRYVLNWSWDILVFIVMWDWTCKVVPPQTLCLSVYKAYKYKYIHLINHSEMEVMFTNFANYVAPACGDLMRCVWWIPSGYVKIAMEHGHS